MAAIEGTFRLDGLIEGPLPAGPDPEGRLRAWVRETERAHLPFSLELEGAGFNLLAAGRPLRVEHLGGAPAATLTTALTALLGAFQPEQSGDVSCTLRSVEVIPGAQVQTIYALLPDGTVNARERTVDAVTTPPPRSGLQARLLRSWPLMLAILIGLTLSTWVIDYPALFTRLRESATPFDVGALRVEATAFEGYLTVDTVRVERSGDLSLPLRRGPGFPLTDSDFDRALAGTGGSLKAGLALQALARGYVRCEYFDREDRFLGFRLVRIAPLREQETLIVRLPSTIGRRPARITLTP